MTMRVVCFLSFCIAVANSLNANDDSRWHQANLEVARLHPSAFPGLPRAVQQRLVALGCRIPQHWAAEKPHNIIHGEFISAGTRSWAALCSRNLRSAVVVFHDDTAAVVSERNRQPDMTFLQGLGSPGAIGYSRILEVAGRDRIIAYFRFYEKPSPRLSHAGIDDVFDGKASVVHYYARGRWLTWPGAD